MSSTPQPAWRNPATLAGSVVATLALLFTLSLLFFDLISRQPSPYLGIFAYLVFPGIMVLGIALGLAGLLISGWRHQRRDGAARVVHYYPRIDLNLRSHRRTLIAIGGALVLTVPFIGVMSYQGYNYTESDQFCGSCHSVMDPQTAAHEQSPHARVDCVDCHVSPGASGFVRAKLAGVRQLVSLTTNAYSRPIPTAIQHLPPAAETCEQCHAPATFHGDQLVTINHYAPDEANTHRPIHLLVHTGGNDPASGPPSGIHWHMFGGFAVEYVATDPALQSIPWVRRSDRKTGAAVVYRSDGRKAADPPPTGTRRLVGCADCHNRAHAFRSPEHSADLALNASAELRALPHAKRELVAALVEPHATRTEGLAGVAAAVAAAYRERQPQVWQTRRADVERLAEAAGAIYRSNFFPEMRVDWRAYPDNIGHHTSAGCFRCHDGKHVDDSGNAISNDCAACHEFLQAGPADAAAPLTAPGGFVHPLPLEGVHATLRCDQCHSGGVAPAPTCKGCHVHEAEFYAGATAAFERFQIKPDVMSRMVDCTACHDPARPATIEALNEKCLDCHDDDEERFGPMLAAWKKEADELLRQAEAHADPESRKLLDLLRRSGPLHNIESTRLILTGVSRGPGNAR